MTWTPAEPPWAVPPRAQIADLHWLAYADATESTSRIAAGVVAAVAWARGGQQAPVSGRTDQPVTRALAEMELWGARAATSPDSPIPIDALRDDLGVDYCPPRELDPQRAAGTVAALSWLLGKTTSPPMPLPARRPDGQLLETQELVDAAMAAEPYKTWGPEERHAARNDARATVERSRRLIARIASVQERVRRSG
ncbi:hypothetical protein ACVGVM_09715 [Pseudonocardia bannensis]|uniref:Uncharacterized protein n=1 Tax=Pseudonocardia bannensis TaxID=630973 RepID=A0A848DG68_9PSEU|nr:hypothetical protein [Pseudonocardia bannensis]NMH91648.1 hypothetical protein [Pseudonocardia bannensis]